jgi:hypothetical protein
VDLPQIGVFPRSACLFDHEHDVMVVVSEFGQPERAVWWGFAGEVLPDPLQERLTLRAGDFCGMWTVRVQDPQIRSLEQS